MYVGAYNIQSHPVDDYDNNNEVGTTPFFRTEGA